jgi:hypothetical protein
VAIDPGNSEAGGWLIFMLRLCLFAAAVAATGCGLISSDITDVDLSLPSKTYTVDSDSFDVRGDPGPVLSMSCEPGNGTCEVAAEQVCTEGQCLGECGAASTCDLIIPIHPYTTVDLAAEKPELAEIDAADLVDVEIDSITYAVSMNSFDRDTPPLVIYVAPANLTTPEPPNAVVVGTIPAIPAGTTIETTEIQMTATGRDRLIDAMEDFRTPFNIIVGADLRLTEGDTIPTGALTTTLSITAHAGL